MERDSKTCWFCSVSMATKHPGLEVLTCSSSVETDSAGGRLRIENDTFEGMTVEWRWLMNDGFQGRLNVVVNDEARGRVTIQQEQSRKQGPAEFRPRETWPPPSHSRWKIGAAKMLCRPSVLMLLKGVKTSHFITGLGSSFFIHFNFGGIHA